MARKSTAATAIEKSTDVQVQLHFDYTSVENGEELQKMTEQISMLWRQSIEAIREVGAYLLEVKETLKHAQFMDWMQKELEPIGLSYDRANGAMNFAKEYERVKGTPNEDAIKTLVEANKLAIIYRIGTETTPEAFRDSVYEMVRDGGTPDRKEVEQLKKMWRQHNLDEAGPTLTAAAGTLLLQTEIAEDKDEIQKIARLSKNKQLMVAKSIASGSAANTREALSQIKDDKDPVTLAEDSTVDVTVDLAAPNTVVKMKGTWQTALKKVEPESVNLSIIECPNSFEWIQTEYVNLLRLLGPTLTPGGIAIISMGHKAITATYDVTEANGLHVLQPLVLRLQPGRTSTIVGINFMTASRMSLVIYKSPFRQPTGMVVDLQTVGGETDAQESVESGIEAGFIKFLTQLGHTDDTLMHVEIDSKKSFNMRDALISGCQFAKKFIAIG